MAQHVVLIGNLSDGFRAVGPFVEFDEAADWASNWLTDSWVMTLEAAKEFELTNTPEPLKVVEDK